MTFSPNKLKFLIAEKGYTIGSIADELGYHRVSVSYLIHGLGNDMPRLRRALAATLGISERSIPRPSAAKRKAA